MTSVPLRLFTRHPWSERWRPRAAPWPGHAPSTQRSDATFWHNALPSAVRLAKHEVHGHEVVVITARRLRAAHRYTAKRLAELRSRQDRKHKGSRSWKRLQARKNRFLAQQTKRTCDIEHKVSRAVVDWAKERKAGTIAIGDVRDVADGKRMAAKTQQKISLWSHGNVRQYIAYKAQAEGITVELVDEQDTSKTCPRCGRQHKPRGRVYRCPMCGLVAHRDAVGAVTILSRKVHGELAKIGPPPLRATTYRYPAWVSRQGKRSPLDTE